MLNRPTPQTRQLWCAEGISSKYTWCSSIFLISRGHVVCQPSALDGAFLVFAVIDVVVFCICIFLIGIFIVVVYIK